jgi:hypothetical protein
MKKQGSKTGVVPAPSRKIMTASAEIINMLAEAPHILDFKPSETAKARVWELVAREKEGTLPIDEKHELDHYAQVEHLMRLVKAQARKRLQRAS